MPRITANTQQTQQPLSVGVAYEAVRGIKNLVDEMLCHSRVIQSNWNSKDETVGLYERHEIQLGKLLGTGGFSDVYEVLGFHPEEDVRNQVYSEKQVEARNYFKNNALTKHGEAKYVMKHLKVNTLEDIDYFNMAAADLEEEAAYLSTLEHENILKIRGWSVRGVDSYLNGEHGSHFLILDRIHETLAERIRIWEENDCDLITHDTSKLSFETQRSKKSQILDRTNVARQIASALEYLHSKNIVFRDLKPDNVGFDNRGHVKLFDFGLAHELPECCPTASENLVFQMSGNIGTMRYMAPEVALRKKYNKKIDTYSWAMVYWSCLTLEAPFATMSHGSYTLWVCRFGQRPSLHGLPDIVRCLLEKSWSGCIHKRLSMHQVCKQLDSIVTNLDVDSERKGLLSRYPGSTSPILTAANFSAKLVYMLQHVST